MRLLAAVCLIGTLSQYSLGVMPRVVALRQAGHTAYNLPTPLPPHDGYIASPRCADIGQVWAVEYLTHTARLLVADCAGDERTRRWMRNGNVIGEVDYLTARAWGVVGRGVRARVCRIGD